MTKTILGAAALLSITACLLAAALHFAGMLDAATFRAVFAAASAAWFITATGWESRRKR
ncbi:MAG: hypothetical protein KIT09_24655 [Bryobacteraceae bacterium]|nr:hypothetical protein [Bryobacteraceae bacterium]